MKKQLLVFGALIGSAISSSAQITVTQSDFAQVGDTIYYGYDTTDATSGLYLESGSSRTWNIANAKKDEVRMCYFLSPNNSPVPAPTNITHVLVDGDVQNTQFINLTSSLMETVLPNPMAAFTGGEQFIRLTSLTFPATYMMQVRDTFKTVQVLPAAMLGLSSLADSIRITFTIKLHNLCDGWGTLTTPTGSYPSLRFKNTVNVDFKIEGKKNILPVWITIPLSSLPFQLPSNQNNVSFIWVHENGKYFLAEATMIADDETTQDEIRYQVPKQAITTGLFNASLANLELQAYPNPAIDELIINANLSNENYQMTVSDITGRVLSAQTISGQLKSHTIDTKSLNNGIYFVKVSGRNGESTIKFVVSK